MDSVNYRAPKRRRKRATTPKAQVEVPVTGTRTPRPKKAVTGGTRTPRPKSAMKPPSTPPKAGVMPKRPAGPKRQAPAIGLRRQGRAPASDTRAGPKTKLTVPTTPPASVRPTRPSRGGQNTTLPIGPLRPVAGGGGQSTTMPVGSPRPVSGPASKRTVPRRPKKLGR